MILQPSTKFESVIHSIGKASKNVLRQSTVSRYASVLSLYDSFKLELQHSSDFNSLPESQKIYAFIASAIDNRKISGNTVRVYLQGLFSKFPDLLNSEKDVLTKLIKSANNINHPVPKRKRPICLEQIKQMISYCNLSANQGIRDRAILSLMYAGGFRRSEVANLKLSDLSISPHGLEVTHYTKTGHKQKFIRSTPQFPVADYLQHWISLSATHYGLIFHKVTKDDKIIFSQEPINPVTICRIVKSYAEKIGLDSDLIGGHSTRRGVATDALRKGAGIKAVQNLLGHSSPLMSLHYQDEANSWEDHATIGLY